MKLNPSKCTFGVRGGKFLGFMVSQRGIEANPEKIEAIIKMQPPSTAKEVQKLAGRMTALNRFISRSSDKGLPFFKVLKKVDGFSWTEQCQAAFEDLKKYLATPPLLTKSKPGETLFLYLAISEEAVSAVLVREEGPARKLRPYFQSHPVVVLTNHPLKKILADPNISGRMVKWSIELSEHGIEYQIRPAIRAQPLADFISELTKTEEPQKTEWWKIFVDGSSTSMGSGAGIIVETPQGDRLQYAIKFSFEASNNEAEYEALITGGKLALAAGEKYLKAHSDSQLVVNQIRGEYEAKESKMTKYLSSVQILMRRFDEFAIEQIPRSKNEEADQLARLASSLTPLKSQSITFLSQERSEVEGIKEEVLTGVASPSWKDELEAYLKTRTLPQDPKEARAIQVRASRFTLIGGELYKRGFSQPYLKCINQDKVEYVLREIHEGSCGNHSGGRALASKALRQGYFWPTMRKDAMDLVRKCKKCQEHANITHLPAAPLQPIQSPCPFDQWGMDIVGKLPRAPGQREYFIVAVDYFSKIILQSLKTKLEEAKGNWVEELLGVLWAYRTTSRRSTGESPFSLVYGTEAVVPVEIGEETLRVQQYEPTSNSSEKHADLDLIQELRNNANTRTTAYKAVMAKAYNSKVRRRGFQVGDLVLRRADAIKNLGKLDVKWERPYQVTEVIENATYKL
ncbi:UNVERIFIED_CONTAM: Ribonuclease HI [Sesamum radiatum]|uniref:Ribonuclease HI n=1 Tax=Sesamum radiatum TaxID=300843 RepID=A0AAW2LM98_SESRA